MSKGLEFKGLRGNVDYAYDEDSATLIIRCDLNGEDLTSKNGNMMAGLGYVNITHNGHRVWGSINLNKKPLAETMQNKNRELEDALAAAMAKIKELEGK
jgi:hypothetical protein